MSIALGAQRLRLEHEREPRGVAVLRHEDGEVDPARLLPRPEHLLHARLPLEGLLEPHEREALEALALDQDLRRREDSGAEPLPRILRADLHRRVGRLPADQGEPEP